MSLDFPATARRGTPDPRLPVRARHLLRTRAVWAIPLIVAAVVVAVMTALYISSVVNPLAHLRGLPVAVVNQDRGAAAGPQHLQIGQQVQAGLLASPAVSGRLHLMVWTLPQAEAAMGRDGLYAALVIPPGFTASLLTVAGLPAAGPAAAGTAPHVQILTNERAGTVGTELATGILQPALAAASRQIGQHLAALAPAALTPAARVLLASPVTVTTAQYRPLPPSTALGLSAFYVALLTLLCGFLGATTVNSVVDSALGYAPREIGPRRRQRQPVPISRWQTLLIKWAVVTALTAVLTALMLAVAAGALGMDAPYPALLWLYAWLCAASVGVGTIALFAVAGTYGQLIGLLLFVYAGLASAGGTVPVQALPGYLRTLSNVEPLRQVLAGTRSIMYFGAQGDAGLARGTLAAALGLLFWLALGTAIVTWYDRKRLYRLHPDLLAHLNHAVQDHKTRQATAPSSPSGAAQPPSGEAGPGRPQAAAQEPRQPASPADLFVFASSASPGRTVLIIDVNPFMIGLNAVPPFLMQAGFHPDAVYRINVDSDGDDQADAGFTFVFSHPEDGTQTGTAYYATGAQAREPGPGGDLLAQGVPVGFSAAARPVHADPARLFFGLRRDPFFADAEGAFHGFAWTGNDSFADKNIQCIALEVPDEMLGADPVIGVWATVSVRRDGTLVQVDRGGHPTINPFINPEHAKDAFNTQHPADDVENYLEAWSSVLQQNGYTPEEATAAALTVLPDILRYDRSQRAAYPNGRHPGDDALMARMNFLSHGKAGDSGLKPHDNLLADFPYLEPPVPWGPPGQAAPGSGAR
jgi:YhgE/Pip-like protein